MIVFLFSVIVTADDLDNSKEKEEETNEGDTLWLKEKKDIKDDPDFNRADEEFYNQIFGGVS